MNQFFRSARFFPHGVRPGHLVVLGAILILVGIAVPGAMGNGVIVLAVGDIWWIVDRLSRQHDSGSGSGSGSGPTGAA